MTFKNWKNRFLFESNPDAASSAPVAPATPPESESSDDAADNVDLFNEMVNDYEGAGAEDTVEGEGDSLAEAEVQPAVPATPSAESNEANASAAPAPSPELPESTEPAATAQPTPVQPEPTAEPVVPPPPQAQPAQLTPEEQQAKLEEHRKTVLPQLQERYKLDEKTVAELESNPGEVLPQLLAQMHYDMTQAIFSGVMSQIPQVVMTQTRQAQKAMELEGKFFGKYPGLAAHQDVVQQALAAAMQSELATTYDQVEQLAATMAAIKLQKPLEELMGRQQAAPAAPPLQAPAPSNVARPIAPNASGAPIAPQAARGQKSTWDDMVEHVLEQSG